ncbi:hypothetical protein ACET3Z_018198 [Daucus carota]
MSPKTIQKLAAQAANASLDNATTSSPEDLPSPPPPSTTSSSSSPSNTIEEDDLSFISKFEDYCKPDQTALDTMDRTAPWFNSFGSFKFRDMIDDMLIFDHPQPSTMNVIEDHFYEEGEDIRLWDFC